MRKFCRKPFENLEILGDGSAYACCPGWLPRPIGNMLVDTPAKIWNDLLARDTRASILDGSFRRCVACPFVATATGPVELVADDVDLSSFQIEMATGPKFLNLAIDLACNLACPSCRSRKHQSSPEDRQRVRKIQAVLADGVLNDLEWLSVSGSGDPFASAPHLELLRSLSPERYPHLKVKLHTNGLLFDERAWESLGSARSMIRAVEVSVDAATPETYALNRGGDWTALWQNLAFIGTVRAQGPVQDLQLSYVVQANNWREAPLFVEVAKVLLVDRVFFSAIRNWGTFSEDEFNVRAAHRLGHPDRHALREQFTHMKADSFVLIGGLLDGMS